jgi:hypothetical protein
MMSMLGPFDRAHAVRWQQSRRNDASDSVAQWLPPARHDVSEGTTYCRPDIARARFLTHAVLGSADDVATVVAELEAAVDERVVAWSPSLFTSSRTELVAGLLDSDDALADIEVTIVGEAISADKVYIEWRLAGRFTNVGFIDNDVLIEPTHLPVEAAGVLIFTFVRSHVSAIECFYDGLALLEQLLVHVPDS